MRKPSKTLISLATSATAHALLLLGLMLNGSGFSGQSKEKPKNEVKTTIEIINVVPKPQKSQPLEQAKQEIAILKTPVKKPLQEKPKVQAPEKCPHGWYGGIGISSSAQVVVEVYPGYPADLGGIKSRDFIVSPPENQIKGTPGTKLSITLLRQSGIVNLELTRDEICY